MTTKRVEALARLQNWYLWDHANQVDPWDMRWALQVFLEVSRHSALEHGVDPETIEVRDQEVVDQSRTLVEELYRRKFRRVGVA